MDADGSVNPELLPGERPLTAFISSLMRPEIQWARDAAVEALTSSPFVTPWAFEYTPAASDGAVATYLQKVRDADIVIWLVGEETSAPVRNEIAEALAAARRIWVVRLPAATRSAETEALLTEVGDQVKWGDADTPDALRELLALTFSDEIIRALRDTPGLTRLALLEQIARASRARMVTRWLAPGLTSAEAIAFADNTSVGAPPSDILPSSEAPLRIVVADVGAGKSVVAERALQGAIVAARERARAPIPVFLHAHDCATGLEAAIRTAAEGLGEPRLQGAFVVIDGLDEVDQTTAARLINAARVVVQAFPETHVMMTSRPTATVATAPERVALPSLSDDDAQALMRRILGSRGSRGLAIHWPRALDRAVHRPLFAILFALDWRDRGTGGTATGQLLASLVERAVDRDRTAVVMPYLQRLAVLVTDRDGAAVASAEVGGFAERVAVGDSRLVIEVGDHLAFSLPIFAQWFAAQSLQAGTPSVTDLATDPQRLNRWRYAIAIAIATGAASFVDALLDALARADPGFAADVLAESLTRWASDEPQEHPDALEAGRQLRHAFLAWKTGIGPLHELLLPATGTADLPPLAIEAEPKWLWTGWHDGSEETDEVVRFSGRVRWMQEPVPGWIVRRGGKWNADKGWAWNWSLEELRHRLDGHIKAKDLRVDNAALTDEALWLLALRLEGRGSLTEVPLALKPLSEALQRLPDDAVVELADRYGSVDLLLARADERLAAGETELTPPWPTSDLEHIGGWIWNPYSDERQLERVIAVYTAAIAAYVALVETWFIGLRPRLLTAAVLPARFQGLLRPSRGTNFTDTPSLDWHWEPLPRGQESIVDIRIAHEGEEPREYEEILHERDATHERLLSLRPEASGWISTTYTYGVADVFQPAPVATIAYDWLENDLKRISWSS